MKWKPLKRGPRAQAALDPECSGDLLSFIVPNGYAFTRDNAGVCAVKTVSVEHVFKRACVFGFFPLLTRSLSAQRLWRRRQQRPVNTPGEEKTRCD